MLIGDEAHTLGADSFLANKPEFFERRLGLSATPERQYDPDGTEQIFDFFGGCVYEFGLDRRHRVLPRAVRLSCSRQHARRRRVRTSSSIFPSASVRPSVAGAAIEDRSLTGLLIRRRRVIETSVSKLDLLRAVLEHRGPRHLTQTLVYASAKNPEQFDRIAALLTDLNIRWAPVTEATTTDRRLLERTLTTFARGGTQVLLAKKVLDQGLDIPSIREAFIVASSMVEREWIQRRGRVLRRHPDKPWAVVHDFLALPPVSRGRQRCHLNRGEDRPDRAPSCVLVRLARPQCHRRARHAFRSGADTEVLLADGASRLHDSCTPTESIALHHSHRRGSYGKQHRSYLC